MSSIFNSRHISQRMAVATVQEMCASTAMVGRIMVGRIVAKRQIICHVPAGGNDPMGAPDL